MLTFFTDPYESELLYGAIGRYHYYIGNKDYKDTIREIFVNENVIPTLGLASYLDNVSNNLGSKYTSNYIIKNHTIFPFYSPFLPENRKIELIDNMKYSDGKGIYHKIGIIAGSVCKKQGIYYCPECAKNDIDKYGEVYIRRDHQLQGVFLCKNNGVKLKKYKINKTNTSRLEFIKLDEKLLDLKVEYEEDEDISEKLISVSRCASYILNTNLDTFNKDIINKKYRQILHTKNLLSINNRIRQEELYDELISFYGDKFLELMESSIDKNDEYNWLKVITRNSNRVVHPIRHILFINFLVENIEVFFETKESDYINPFGKSPWPCLNVAAEHYKKDVVENINITSDYKTRNPIGTFTCDCGFIYSRKGPDKDSKDRYKIGRIKEFGHVWEDKIQGYLSEGRYGLRELSRIMSCDPKTIIKFDKNLDINYFRGSNIKIDKAIIKTENKDTHIETYKKNILNKIMGNPTFSRTEIRKLCQKEYTYLYSNDKNWLLENLPEVVDKSKINFKSNERVNWEKRDKEIVSKLKIKYNKLIEQEKPIRISKSSLCKEINILTMIEKNIKKLPLTEAYFNLVNESIEDFQIRRSKLIVDKKYEDEEYIKLWQVQRLAGIRTDDFMKINNTIQKHIDWRYKH